MSDDEIEVKQNIENVKVKITGDKEAIGKLKKMLSESEDTKLANEDLKSERDNLQSEVEELKGDLNIIAEQRLKEKSAKYGCASTLEAVRDYELEHNKASIFSQNNEQNKEGEYDTAEQAILAINEMAKNDPELKNQLGKVAKKSLKSDKFDIEFEPTLNPQTGKMSLLSAWRSPKRIGTENPQGETQEAFQKRKLQKKLEMKIKVKD
ncbi:MAG: hypothetical protein ABSC20_06300 [Candidatus Bathyarchaeia archaeon]|jgi:hypothetical protein